MTDGYIAKGLGGDHIGLSVMFESGSNIGIGTTSPLYKLDVAGGISLNGRPVIDNSSAELYIGGITGISGRGIDVVTLYTANTERMRITSGGNVGIGTTNPSRTLDVTGTFRVITPNRSFFVTSNAYSISDGTLSSGIGMDGDGLYLGSLTSSTGWTISNPQLTIRSSGNVGIGTTAPDAALAVHGQFKIKTTSGDGNESRLFFNPGGAADPAQLYLYNQAQSNTV
jgi:hypothetical protein